MVKVVIAGSQRLFRVGLKSILTQHFAGEVEVHESNDDSSIAACRDLQPDIVLLDVDISVGSGLELASRLVEAASKRRVVVITSKSEPHLLDHLIGTGAAAYITKNCSEEDFVEAFTEVIEGRSHVSEKFSRLVTMGKMERPSNANLSDLSRREMEVMLLLAEGRSSDEIANRISVSPKTVATYKQRIHDKLNTRNTADITRVAVQSGLLTCT